MTVLTGIMSFAIKRNKRFNSISSYIALLRQVRQMGSNARYTTTVLLGPMLQGKNRKRGGKRKKGNQMTFKNSTQ